MNYHLFFCGLCSRQESDTKTRVKIPLTNPLAKFWVPKTYPKHNGIMIQASEYGYVNYIKLSQVHATTLQLVFFHFLKTFENYNFSRYFFVASKHFNFRQIPSFGVHHITASLLCMKWQDTLTSNFLHCRFMFTSNHMER